MESIADNLEKVSQRIQKATNESGRLAEDVRLLAVTKKRSPVEIRVLYELGQRCFGENYLNEALPKIELMADRRDIEWHFIGPIQSNKTRPIAEHFDWVQSVDRLKIARRLAEQRPAQSGPLNVLVQVNINDEDSKSGVPFNSAIALAEQIAGFDNLKLRGLMTIPKANQSAESLASSFASMYELFKKLRGSISTVDTLSMGMSGDLEQAIMKGSTMVRVGTALFGPRPL